MRRLFKYAFLFWFGGSTYVTFEVFFRGYSHWTMFLLSGILFLYIDALNEIWDWNIVTQTLCGTLSVVVAEFLAGCILNLWLGLNIWDYSNMPLNLMGQICLPFTALWIPIVLLAIVLSDVIRWWFFGEEKPHYTWRFK